MTTQTGTKHGSGGAAQPHATLGTGPGFAPVGVGRAGHETPRKPRPPAAGRAGLVAWLPVCLSLGIAIWSGLPLPRGAILWFAIAVVILCAGLCAQRAMPWAERGWIGAGMADGLRIGAMGIALVATGIGLSELRSARVAAPVLEWRYYGPVEGRLVEIDRSARDRIRLTLDQVHLRDLPPERTPRRVRLSLIGVDEDSLPSLGQRAMMTGHLGPPPGPASPGSFDFRRHARFAGLGAVGYTRTPVLAVAPAQDGMWWMHRARLALSDSIATRIGGQEGAVAAALMTGDRSGIHESTNEIMRASNLYHIISISGLHMSMLAGFVYAALRIGLVMAMAWGAFASLAAHKIAACGALLAATAYLWLSGGGVATERAFVMVAVMLGAILVDRRAISLRTVAVAAAIILIYSPESLTSPGFQMSFAATVALILSYGPWSRLAPHVPIWLRPVAMLLVSSLVAGLATSPIAAAHFNRMAQYGLLANLLAVPVMGTFVMPAGVIGAILAPLGLAGPALWVMGLGTAWMLKVAEFVAGLGGAVTAIPLPPGPTVALMEFGAVICVLCWRHNLSRSHSRLLRAGFVCGTAMMLTSAVIWLGAERPLLLIAPQGEAVGLMTPAGRAISKPGGGAFVVKSWLREDGDTALQAQAAQRPAWRGDKRDRQAGLPDGWQIWHLTGKGASERARPKCREKTILVSTEPLDLPADAACLMLDPRKMRQTGAIAINFGKSGPILTQTDSPQTQDR
ncbi:ComEC/Rec2 family competence protein [Paracoccus sp. Z330]|uniref:ComEC/Rec2 family competence protein n=1 Tax=Paracoccus onchidii TaxID=3017813 RepID=A0ABT4ZB04_9RHOB|nr:ComEC/Rec2 family competence protein [Paracoccus onchidii]MDB6176534.1 ComEC/Rec2 family competence protein [Paracoccus onchidii]